MKKFKKIYIEITNTCNLNCEFCIKNSRKNKFMTFEEFKTILKKIKPHTNYIYMHILGEPLMHPEINKYIEYAKKEGFNINITTNGYLIQKLNQDVRQINISLHSYNGKIELKKYLENIFDNIEKYKNTYISLRIWVKNKYYNDIIKYIKNKYKIEIPENFNNIKLKENIYLNTFHEFIWPDLNNNHYEEKGKCYGLIDHIGILCDGTIIPCCLDSKGIINLGNIYEEELEKILNSERVKNMIEGFKNNKKCEELCKHCSFLEK